MKYCQQKLWLTLFYDSENTYRFIHTHTYTCMHTHVRTHTHTYTHTHTHTHTHTEVQTKYSTQLKFSKNLVCKVWYKLTLRRASDNNIHMYMKLLEVITAKYVILYIRTI